MDSSLIESLLYQSEGTALDFKAEQYDFIGCSDDTKKSELLKDILAFANSWRQGKAYIVIGVKASEGGRHIPVGADEHFDDAQLQQFINSKTNRKLAFAYEVHLYENLKIGVIRIPKQERPSYATRTYGKVEKNVVYYRLGSSTAIATPEDIARMGKEEVESKSTPQMNLQFADHATRNPLGSNIPITCRIHPQPTQWLPDLQHYQKSTLGELTTYSAMNELNSDYWREMEAFVRLKRLLKPVTFLLKNNSGVLAEKVRLEVTGTSTNGIAIADGPPPQPAKRRIDALVQNISPRFLGESLPSTNVTHRGKTWTLTTEFGNIQPKATSWSEKPFYVGSLQQKKLDMEVIIYANNLPEPQKTLLTIDFDIVPEFPLVMDQLEFMSRQIEAGLWE